MNTVDQVPVLILHVLETDITQDTSVVEEHIDATKVLNGSLDDALSVLDAVVVGDGLTAGGADLVDDHICGLRKVSEYSKGFVEANAPLMTGPRPCEKRRGR